MTIVFFCDHCGARFEVASTMAGKKGHCKKCGEHMTIPSADRPLRLAAARGIPVAAAAPAAATAGRGEPMADASLGWLKSAVSNVALAPLTLDGAPGSLRRHSPASDPDDVGDSNPYSLIESRKLRARTAPGARMPTAIERLWKGQLGGLQKLARGIGSFAYLISMPFFILLFIGVATKSRPTAVLAAAVIIGLNLARVATGLVNLALVYFKRGPLQGILFLIPPINLIMLASDWGKLHKSIRGLIEPAVIISVVIAAFLVIPSLKSGKKSDGSISDQLRTEAKAFGSNLETKVERLKQLDVGKLGEAVSEKASALKGQAPQ